MVGAPKQFDVCENRGASRARAPLLIVMQHPVGNTLETRLAVPLVPAARRHRLMERIEPTISVAGAEHVAVVSQLRALPLEDFGPVVSSASAEQYALQNAVDFLITGY